MGGAYSVGLKDILVAGGLTLALLIALSVYAFATIWERWSYFRRALARLSEFTAATRKGLGAGDLEAVAKLCRQHPGAAATAVVWACLSGPRELPQRRAAAERALEREVSALEARLAVLGTIGSIAPFIGLFGTVLGVMRAFRDLATAANAGPGVVAVGISEALVATAAGLFVAIPAIVAYNYFTTRTNRFADELRWISDELLDRIPHAAGR